MKKKHLLNKYGTLMANELINMGTPMDIDDRFTTGSDGSLSENPYGLNLNPINVFGALKLLDSALFIVSNGTYQIPANYEHPVQKLTPIFDHLAQLYETPYQMFDGLIRAYNNLYKIDLHIVASMNNKYTIVNKNSFKHYEGYCICEKHAFLLFNVENTIFYPLGTENNGNIRTTYTAEETNIWQWMEEFVNMMNQSIADENSIWTQNSLQSLEESVTGTIIDNNSSVTNLSNSETTAIQTGDAIFKQMLQQLEQLYISLKPKLHNIQTDMSTSVSNIDNIDLTSPSSVVEAIQARLSVASKLAQIVLENQRKNSLPPNENSTNLSSILSSTPLPDTISTPQMFSSSTSTITEFSHEKPLIIIEPKEDWLTRLLSDLIPKFDKKAGKEKVRMPLLQGVGGQRTRIQIKVPCKRSGTMYLGIDVLTLDNQHHPYMRILPEKTEVDKKLYSENKPDCFMLNKCDSKHHYHHETEHIYLEITEANHRSKYIDLPIYMYKLLQNYETLTKVIIKNRNLDQCKLAFWYCSRKNKVYVQISPISFSCIIKGDENSSSNEEISDDEQVQTVNPDVFRVSYNATNSDDENNVKRVVRSKKEKRYKEIEDAIEKIQHAIGIRDISQVYECFENLVKIYRRVIENDQSNLEISRSYIQILNQLDDLVNKSWNDQDWYNKANANHFRQKLRRYLKQQSIPHETINDDKSVEQKHAIVNLSREEEILAKLDEINSMRGKRGINYQNQFESLNALRQQVDKENLDVKIIIKILFTQITINLDQENEYVKHSTLDYIEELIALLPGNTESDDNLIALIVQMNEKYKQSLQHTDLYSQDYIERLKDECRIYTILDRLKTYFKSTNHLCTIYLLMIEYIYYKISDQSSITLIDCYCKYIYMNDILNHARTRASLCQIYHLALHDYYYQARDLMLMCHLQDTIHSSDILTQILYNRTMIQLGLCAFRCGKIFEAHQALVDFQSGNRIKELLGQDIHLPYHMHINLQLIECIYFISAMLIEIPSIRKHVISKRFYNLMLRAEKQTILGPPESMQEHIIAASQAMKAADWKICINYLINEKMKNIIWKFIPKSSQVIEMLINKIKEESLRIYLITSAICFSNISIPALTDMFQLPIKSVYSIISKMIINQELIATIEPSDEIVSIHAHHPSEIENLSIDLMEKTCRLNEQNYFLSKTIQ